MAIRSRSLQKIYKMDFCSDFVGQKYIRVKNSVKNKRMETRNSLRSNSKFPFVNTEFFTPSTSKSSYIFAEIHLVYFLSVRYRKFYPPPKELDLAGAGAGSIIDVIGIVRLFCNMTAKNITTTNQPSTSSPIPVPNPSSLQLSLISI